MTLKNIATITMREWYDIKYYDHNHALFIDGYDFK